MKIESLNSNSLAVGVRWLQIVFISVLLLYFGKSLFIPLSFALLIAFISYPLCKWLENRHWPRSLAIGLIILVILILFLPLLGLLGYELNILLKELPRIRTKVGGYSPGIQIWLKETLGIGTDTQSAWINKIIYEIQNGLGSSLKLVLNTTVSTLFMFVMIPVFASLFLYHRGSFVKFLESLVGESYRENLHHLLHLSIVTYFRFVKGTFFVYIIVGILNSAGLLMLGIEHAVLFGMITAFMTIVPYIGIIISALLPLAVAIITKDSLWYPVGVIVVFTFVQYLEANVIFPRVVGIQLNLSTWSTLVAIMAGTILWGVAGMILFIPMLAILKIISDQVPGLKSLNILLNRQEGYKGR